MELGARTKSAGYKCWIIGKKLKYISFPTSFCLLRRIIRKVWLLHWMSPEGTDVVNKKVKDVMSIVTGHEREEIEGRKRSDMDAPCGLFGTEPSGGPSNILFSEDPVTKTSRKLNNQKFAELNGNDIFKGDAPLGSAEKLLSVAKLREMNGSDIFADGKASSKDYLGGVRKPAGGESSIALV